MMINKSEWKSIWKSMIDSTDQSHLHPSINECQFIPIVTYRWSLKGHYPNHEMTIPERQSSGIRRENDRSLETWQIRWEVLRVGLVMSSIRVDPCFISVSWTAYIFNFCKTLYLSIWYRFFASLIRILLCIYSLGYTTFALTYMNIPSSLPLSSTNIYYFTNC